MLFRYQGHIGAYLVLAGADIDGGHLYTIHAHGSTDKIPFTSMGSGKYYSNYGFVIKETYCSPMVPINLTLLYIYFILKGMLAATAVLENGWRKGMTEEEAKKLVRDAIAAGIINDMGSGSNVDLAIIKPNDSIEVNNI